MSKPRDPDIPSWYADSSLFANNPSAHAAALARWSLPVTTPEERELAGLSSLLRRNPAALIGMPPASPARTRVEAMIDFARKVVYPCHKCGRFAFPKPMYCFWCRSLIIRLDCEKRPKAL